MPSRGEARREALGEQQPAEAFCPRVAGVEGILGSPGGVEGGKADAGSGATGGGAEGQQGEEGPAPQETKPVLGAVGPRRWSEALGGNRLPVSPPPPCCCQHIMHLDLSGFHLSNPTPTHTPKCEFHEGRDESPVPGTLAQHTYEE